MDDRQYARYRRDYWRHKQAQADEPPQVTDPLAGCPTPRQESDEYVCGKCRLRWDTHEDKPTCPKG